MGRAVRYLLTFTRLQLGVWNMPWGGSFDVSPVAITGQPMFDYFFTLVLLFGIVSFMVSLIVKVLNRS